MLTPTLSRCRFNSTSSLILGLAFVVGFQSLSDARTWTDSSGKFRVEADYVGQKDGKVLLKKQNGITIGVPVNRLSKTDLDFLRSAASGGPAPTGANPLASVQSAEDTIRMIGAEVEKGNLGIMWHALPISYQADVNDLVHTFAGKMDRDIWNKGFGVAGKTLTVLKSKKDFILAQEALKSAPIETDAMSQNWDALVDLLAILVNSDISDLDKMKALDVGSFLNGPMKEFTTKAIAMSKSVSPQAASMISGSVPKVTTLKDDGDTVTLKIEGPALPPGLSGASAASGGDVFADGAVGADVDVAVEVEDAGPREVVAVRVEGRWLPKEMVDGWPASIAAAKQAINGLSTDALAQNKQKILGGIAMVDGILDQLMNAQTADEFNRIVGDVMTMAGPMIGGPGGPPPGGGGTDNPFGAAAPAGDDPF